MTITPAPPGSGRLATAAAVAPAVALGLAIVTGADRMLWVACLVTVASVALIAARAH
jgi:type IV secretory pathway VirB2 component (pilin)